MAAEGMGKELELGRSITKEQTKLPNWPHWKEESLPSISVSKKD